MAGAEGVAARSGGLGPEVESALTGLLGQEGASGRSGVRGSEGVSGRSGGLGPEGVRGAAGVLETTGGLGSADVLGAAGASGRAGLVEAAGASGRAGLVGAAGALGPAGVPGPVADVVPALGDVRQEGRGLSRAAVRLDAVALEERLEAALTRYGLVTAWQEVMAPTLHAVGRKWASSGDRYVEVEHLLSWHVSTALRRHTRQPAPPSGAPGAGPVLLACVPGEQHTLPLEALNAALSRLGVPARMFGAAVPAEALLAAVRRLGPAAVVLWAQARSTASLPLAEHVTAMEWGVKGARARPLVLLGGPGWSGRPTRGMLRPASLSEALDILAATHPAAPSVEPP
ncbi:cobalamin B12-binding domain-containing protein [Streptomyces rameus]|uniref:cobalamin B12-binding domain-containing protein n=1 Tax=Streptomyces rameus TaxID=68261 RepID=UPI003CD070BB